MLAREEWSIPKVHPVAKPDVFSLESLIAWLEKQPPGERYDWDNCDGGCLIGLYGASHGISWAELIAFDETTRVAPYNKLTPGGIACKHPRTFGAALTRARAALR